MTLSKKILLGSFAAAMAFSGASLAAAAPGWYVGAQGGWSKSNSDTAPGVNVTDTGFAWGLRGGYQFDQIWSAELGYTRYADTKISVPGTTLNGKIEMYAIDLVGKGTLNLDNGFGLYGKAGLAYVNGKSSGTDFSGDSFSGSASAYRPIAGLGVKYDFNQNVAVDLGVTRIFKGGNLLKDQDAVMVGVSYYFG